ncbi:polysaccharide biosynthesis tyrosine autokinase [Sphingomonas sp. HH69]
MAGQTLQDKYSDPDSAAALLLGEESKPLFGFDIKQLMGIVRRNAIWIALIIVVAVVLGGVITLLTRPRYDATASVLVEEQADQIIEGGDLQQTGTSLDINRFLQTQIDILKSRTLARRIVESGKLDSDPRFFEAMGSKMPENSGTPTTSGTSRREGEAVGMLVKNLHADLPQDSRVIQIRISCFQPAYCAKLANLYAQNFIENNLSQKFASSAYARKFLAGQLEDTRERLAASERKLNQYSRTAGLIRTQGGGDNKGAGTDGDLSVTNSSLIQINTAANAATADRIAAQQTWQAIANQPILSVPQVISNATIQSMLQQKAQVESNLAEERSRHLDDYPTVKSLRAQIAEINNRINTIGNSIKRSVHLEYETALDQENSLKAQMNNVRSEALGEQDRGVQYNILKRVAETDRAQYDSLLERYNQITATAGAASNNISLVDQAEAPSKPSSPNLFFNLFTSFLLGLIVAVIFAFVREYFDDTIHSPSDVESKLGLPLLGLIPVSPNVDESLRDPKSSTTEAYHSLVTNLRYATSTGLPKTLMITSSNDGEGKTTTAMSVSRDIASYGKRVLLIDADLRRPTLHRHFDKNKQSGLPDVLVGISRLEDVIFPSGIPSLDVMTGIPMPPDPSLLLGGEGLPRLIEEACKQYDHVIIDAPPLLGISDAVSISSTVDCVLFIINASSFHGGAVKSGLRRLALVGAPVLGVVLTKFDPANSSEYSYYGNNYYSYGRESVGEA